MLSLPAQVATQKKKEKLSTDTVMGSCLMNMNFDIHAIDFIGLQKPHKKSNKKDRAAF